MMSRIGIKINELRTARSMTRKQLAKLVGVTEKYIEEVELGRRVISDDLMKRLSKALEQEFSDLTVMEADDRAGWDKDAVRRSPAVKSPAPAVQDKPVNELWNDALGSVLKNVPVYRYDMAQPTGSRQLPLVSNRIEGYARDKVLFLEIQDNEMIGFRMARGDMAFGYLTTEIENNAICLLEYGGRHMVRQVKKLGGEKVLLVGNNGSMTTDTVNAKEIRILARLVKLEIKL